MVHLTQIFFALSNPKRITIYQMCLTRPMNVTEISSKLKQSYKSTINNLRILEEAEMIKREEKITKVREVLISSIPFKEGTIYKKVYEQILIERK